MKNLLLTAVVATMALASPGAQSLDPMTAEDTLNVRTANVLDLSDDGRRVAIGVRKLADNATTDHRRYGDPTYFAPSMVELMVIDTGSATAERVGKGLLNIRQAAWDSTGARLALLTAAETPAGLAGTTLWIYDADRKTLSEVPRHAGTNVAANSG